MKRPDKVISPSIQSQQHEFRRAYGFLKFQSVLLWSFLVWPNVYCTFVLHQVLKIAHATPDATTNADVAQKESHCLMSERDISIARTQLAPPQYIMTDWYKNASDWFSS